MRARIELMVVMVVLVVASRWSAEWWFNNEEVCVRLCTAFFHWYSLSFFLSLCRRVLLLRRTMQTIAVDGLLCAILCRARRLAWNCSPFFLVGASAGCRLIFCTFWWGQLGLCKKWFAVANYRLGARQIKYSLTRLPHTSLHLGAVINQLAPV